MSASPESLPGDEPSTTGASSPASSSAPGRSSSGTPGPGAPPFFDGQSDEPFTWDEPNDINSWGDVVGYSTASDGTTLATLWHT
jgi:hypothetical protein